MKNHFTGLLGAQRKIQKKLTEYLDQMERMALEMRGGGSKRISNFRRLRCRYLRRWLEAFWVLGWRAAPMISAGMVDFILPIIMRLA